MVNLVRFGKVAERWVRPRSDSEGDDPPFTTDEHGFAIVHEPQTTGWLRPAEAGQSGAWVLLGEPGAGKTTAFRELISEHERDVPPEAGEPGTLWLTGAEIEDRYAADQLLKDHLDALPKITEAATSAPLRIVIDQLDESGYLSNLAGWLSRYLAKRNTQNLRIWLACRTAEYPAALSKVLAERLGSCLVSDLAPLSRTAAQDLVESTTATFADAFFADIERYKAGMLASIPLTLKLLISAYQQNPEAIKAGPIELFRLGINAMASEPNTIKDKDHTTTTEQRVAIAARVATHLQLSGRRSVHFGTIEPMADQAVLLDAVMGTNSTTGTVVATKDGVQETLATALFDRRHDGMASFAHSSFAAFLAARYLARRLDDITPIPRRQLEELFLISAPDEDTAAIPEHLRETAAWLIAHAPGLTRWMVAADPEALTAHSNIITCPDTRALIVDNLLARADRIELRDRSWERARWDLTHPGLESQLATAFSDALTDPDEWDSFARARLALRIAQDSELPGLAELVLQVTETSQWPLVLRQNAAKAAMTLRPDTATVDRLRDVLASLLPTDLDLTDTTPMKHDSPLELVGTLLHLLWPSHLGFGEAAPHIRPVASRGFFGMYRAECIRFASCVHDDDLPKLISYTQDVLVKCGVNLDIVGRKFGIEELEDEPLASNPSTWVSTPENTDNLRSFALAAVEQVLLSPRATELLDDIISMTLWFLGKSSRVPLPVALSLENKSTGVEPDAVRQLRHEFAKRLLATIARFDPTTHQEWIYKVAYGWTIRRFGALFEVPPDLKRTDRACLLDVNDLPWIQEYQHMFANAGDSETASLFGLLAVRLSPQSVQAIEPEEQSGWADAEAFADLQRARLDKAVDGDTTAFWHWAKYLHLDPGTGQPGALPSWDVQSFPGATLWPTTDLADRFTVAASHFVTTADDNFTEWLGTRGDWIAHAGFLALAHLAKLDTASAQTTGQPSTELHVPAEAWGRWAGAILDDVGRFGSNEPTDQMLLRNLAEFAPAQLTAALNQLVRTTLANHPGHLRLTSLPPAAAEMLTSLAGELSEALRAEPTTEPPGPAEPRIVSSGPIVLPTGKPAREAAIGAWAALLHQPAKLHLPNALTMLFNAVADGEAHPHPDTGRALAVRAAHLLLLVDPATHWPAICDRVPSGTPLAKHVAVQIGASDDRKAIIEHLNEATVESLYDWLVTTWPPETEDYDGGFVSLTREHEVHFWRREIVKNLSQRATPDAVTTFATLSRKYPEQLELKAALDEARRGVQTKAVNLLTSAQVNTLLDDDTRRIVRTAAQLADVIADTITQIEEDLTTHPNVLWDCERGPRPANSKPKSARPETWRPKPEGTIGSYIAHELTLRLRGRRVVINREVVIKPTGAGDAGERPDIKVDVLGKGSDMAAEETLTVPIEIKGAWHEDVLTAQKAQLAERYLNQLRTSDGVYLVAWFELSHWTTLAKDDRRITEARRHDTAQNLGMILRNQAAEIRSTTGKRTTPLILTINRAIPATKRAL